jgi:hypothetical protein
MGCLYSYVLRYDDGAAPNPFWEICTLTICKPAIRRTAEIGDWIIGTGSKNSKINNGKTYDFSDSIVYAMKVTDKKSLADYNESCIEHLPNKIPKWFDQDWRKRMGDCIYDFSSGIEPTIRKSVHNESNRDRDLGGLNALLSTHFYYFGEEPRPLPDNLRVIIKKNQGHLKIEKQDIIETFEHWIQQFEKNTILGDPQLKHEFDRVALDDHSVKCSTRDLEDDKYEGEEIIC